MKYIELHDETDTFYVNVNAIGIIETTILPTRLRISSKIDVNGNSRYCRETVKEILQKITKTERCETEFMDDRRKEVDEQLKRVRELNETHGQVGKGKLTISSVGKEENSYA